MNVSNRRKELMQGCVIGLAMVLVARGVGFAGVPVEEGKLESVEAGEKKKFEYRLGDAVFTFGGKISSEHRFAKNATMLNKNLPDETNHFRSTLDTRLGFAYGEKKFGHKAVEVGSSFRFKTIWGKIGYQSQTERNEPFKFVDAAIGEHSHASTRSLMWVKDAWLQASWNAIFGIESKKVHYAKFGMFSFYLGRGIALGPFYGYIPRDFLGIYSRDTDYSPTGILLTGEILKDWLWYDLYYAKFEDKSASFSDVFNSNKEKVLGRRTTPWSGPAKDSDVFAARLKIKPLDDKNTGKLELEPYIMYNEASDQKAETIADSKSMLGAVGIGAEYTNKNFECGGEVAFNYGHEYLYPIDRNVVSLKNEKYGTENLESVRQVYSHITYVWAGDDTDNPVYNGKNVIVNTNTETSVINNRKAQCGAFYNGKTWTPPAEAIPAGSSVTDFKNADNRYRCSYKNKYRGWMAVVDASYLFGCIDLKVAGAYGYASGDENPHVVEIDKNYDGFVGLYELYSGKRVPSVFILDARKVRRPLTLRAGSTEAEASDASFTDLHHVGFGVDWAPECLKDNKFNLNANLLFFWKDHPSRKYDSVNNVVCDCVNARKFMGTEFNLITNYELLKDLVIKGIFAMFFPGGYYKDINGVPMRGDIFKKLEATDYADFPSQQYRLGYDTAYYTQVVLEYSF